MRTLMKVTFPTMKATDAVRTGRMPKELDTMVQELKPEATYFYPDDGHRSALIVFDLKDPSQMPAITERLFEMEARVTFSPVMNMQDLKKGMEQIHAVAAHR
jgi:hypothetical protein